jgi:predicted DNA-binding ribbon-helix-helix protein
MKSTIIKRSIVLNGRKTSVSLEAEFWDGLREIACAQKINLTTLAQQIDQGRNGGNFSSAIRVFVFNHMRAQIAKAQTSQQILPESPMEQRRISA